MGDQPTILIADRNAHVRGFLKRELTAEGYQVRLAENGKQVLKGVFHPDPLDLIILDPDLPDSDENILLKRLQDRIPSLPIIIHAFRSDNEFHWLLTTDAVFVEKGGKSIECLKLLVAEILARKKSK